MSTNDVPGANPRNGDKLAMGAWAEHDDGSLIFVESTEDDRVIYSIFDVSVDPVMEYRDSMKVGAFKTAFSWDPKNKAAIKWTWHDKTPFPWDRVIKKGAKDGVRHVHAEEVLTAAERVRRSREIHQGRKVVRREVEARVDRSGDKAKQILKRLQKALEDMDL